MASHPLFSRSSDLNVSRGASDVARKPGFGSTSPVDFGPEGLLDGIGSEFELWNGPWGADGASPAATAGGNFASPLAAFSAAPEAASYGSVPPGWSDPRNLELALSTDDLVDAVTIENYVDVRLKLGDGVTTPSGRTYEVAVLNAERGEIDASALDGGLVLTLATAPAEAAAGNAFAVTGSGFDDTVSYGVGESVTGAPTDSVHATVETNMGGNSGSVALTLAYGYDDAETTGALVADWEADGAVLEANGRFASHRDAGFALPAEGFGLGLDGASDKTFEIEGTDMLGITIGGAFGGEKASAVTIDLSLFYEFEPAGQEFAVVTLHDGETEVFRTTFGSDSGNRFDPIWAAGRAQIVIDGGGAFVFDRVTLEGVNDTARHDPHDFVVRGVTFSGVFAAGGDEAVLGPGRDIVTYDATDAGNGVDRLAGFESGADLLRIDTAGDDGAGVNVAERGGDTVFTFDADPAKAIIVSGVTGLVAGEDYVFL